MLVNPSYVPGTDTPHEAGTTCKMRRSSPGHQLHALIVGGVGVHPRILSLLMYSRIAHKTNLIGALLRKAHCIKLFFTGRRKISRVPIGSRLLLYERGSVCAQVPPRIMMLSKRQYRCEWIVNGAEALPEAKYIMLQGLSDSKESPRRILLCFENPP